MFSSERNKELIEELINDENEEISNYFRGLFDITFLECLIYFRDDNIYNEYLQGFPKFSDIKENFEKKEGINFTEHIMKYLQRYEEFLNNKKPRKNKKWTKKAMINVLKYNKLIFNYLIILLIINF